MNYTSRSKLIDVRLYDRIDPDHADNKVVVSKEKMKVYLKKYIETKWSKLVKT